MIKDMTEEWQPPKHIKPWMVCAAIRAEGKIICGARHFDGVMHGVIQLLDEPHGKFEQGFIDQWGRFYNRTEAMKAVKESGQPFNANRNSGEKLLFSEGLY